MGNYSQQPTSGFKGSKLKSFLVMMNIVLSWSILNAQNVGIGTNNPSAKLHIFGNSITRTQHLKLEENDIDYARLGYYNNGTTNFGKQLHSQMKQMQTLLLIYLTTIPEIF